jgi:DNA-binding transcriptional MocR family regulator
MPFLRFCIAIAYAVCLRNAGFFLWIDLSACLQEWSWEAEDALKQKLYDNGVEMSSGRAYHAETPGRFRFLFSVDRDTLMEGLRRYVITSFQIPNK